MEGGRGEGLRWLRRREIRSERGQGVLQGEKQLDGQNAGVHRVEINKHTKEGFHYGYLC